MIDYNIFTINTNIIFRDRQKGDFFVKKTLFMWFILQL